MPRNFGVRRNHLARDLFDGFWHDNDNQHEPRWPKFVIGVAALALFAACMLL